MKSWDQMFSVQDEVTRGDLVASPLDRPDLLIGGRNYLRSDYPGMVDYPNKVNMMVKLGIQSMVVSNNDSVYRTFPIKGGGELLRLTRAADGSQFRLHHYNGTAWVTLIDAVGTLPTEAEPRMCYNEARGLAFIWYNSSGSEQEAHWITEPGLSPTKYNSNQSGSIDNAIRTSIYEPNNGKNVTGACFNKAGDKLYIYSPYHGLLVVTEDANNNWTQISVLSSQTPDENRNGLGVAYTGLETVEDVPIDDPAYGNIILSSGMGLCTWNENGDVVYQGKHQEDIRFSFNSLTSTYKLGYERILIKNKLVVTRDRISLDGGLSWNYFDIKHSQHQNDYYNYSEISGTATPSYRQHLPCFVYADSGDIYCIGGLHLLSNQLVVFKVNEDGTVSERGNYIHFVGGRPILEYYDVDSNDASKDVAYIYINHSVDKKGGMCVRYRLTEQGTEKGVKIFSPFTEDPTQFYVPRLKGTTDRMGNTVTKVKVKDAE